MASSATASAPRQPGAQTFMKRLTNGDEIARLTDLSVDIAASSLCFHERRAPMTMLSVVR